MPRALPPSLLALLLASPALGAVIGEPKKAYQDVENDKPNTHVEMITQGRHDYVINLGGAIDGAMTRMPVGYSAFRQGWQPNRSVRIENIGESDVQNPWLVVNGHGDWRTMAAIVEEATRGANTEAERARAIYEFVRRRRFHACTWDAECSDALKALNVYGYTLCGNQAVVLSDLWNAAGLKTRRCYPIGHCVSEVFYDGGFHLLDSDEHVICLLRDNQTIASAEAIVRDHDLVKRTHTYGITHGESRRTDEFSASLYVYEGQREGNYGKGANHSMDLTLRPGEGIELRWDHIGKQYSAGQRLEKGQKKRDGLGDLLAGWGPTAYDNMRNGKLRYRPDLSSPLARLGTQTTENVTFDEHAGQFRPTAAAQPGCVTWRFASPYVFVGGRASADVRLGAGASAEWRYSVDGESWSAIATAGQGQTESLVASLDDIVSPPRQPAYRFWLQLLIRGDAAVKNLDFEHDIQTSALSLPELSLGENQIVYCDATVGERKVRITHQWLERTAWHPPSPPAEALKPQDGETVEGTQVSFAWSEPSDPDGDEIVDYHFELSSYADMRWPLSPNFERIMSLTPSRGEPQWTTPHLGLLNPDTTYYWRVRALDASGVWGPWSRTHHFRIRAPGVPLDVKLEPEREGHLTLTWKPNPQGRSPVSYKVYGSNEKGFSVSDSQYSVFRGKGFVAAMEEYDGKPADAPDAGMVETPGNLIARVSETRLEVVGPNVKSPQWNRAFYRVVAIDSEGNESGPSDYAAAPRPLVYSRPKSPVKAGDPFRYQPQIICSIGDLRCRPSPSSSYNAAFWDREQLTFQAIRLPAGLSLDPHTGLISGTPNRPGECEIVFQVTATPGKSATFSQRLVVEE